MNEQLAKNRVVRNCLAVFCMLILSPAVGMEPVAWALGDAPKTERSVGEQRQWYEDFFQRSVLSLARNEDRVMFVSDGAFGLRGESEWVTSFSLESGGIFYQAPDDHSSCEFKVLELGDEGITLEYTSRFDHRSFGRDLITIDTATIFLEYRPMNP